MFPNVGADGYRFLQNPGVSNNNTVNNSNRPMSMNKVLSHLAASGRASHEKAGPHIPIPGPTLAKLDMTTL